MKKQQELLSFFSQDGHWTMYQLTENYPNQLKGS